MAVKFEIKSIWLKMLLLHISQWKIWNGFGFTEAVFWKCSIEKVFLEISQNLQESTYARVSFLIKLHASSRIIKLTSECHLIFKAAIFENKSAKFENYS